ncbi:MAG: thiamine pyrophosphate-binding protein [Gemmataceae bacterium]|nr:thiamine pyrophosphate-binding protein [Gemmata sp.]MDW8199355.1 thiamine pyrophosphate-binding protein [Gemmataceae bacterium]
MIDPQDIVSALASAGFTHVVWIPDSHLGRWEAAILASRLSLIRVCREGEAVGVAMGLILGGAKPVVVIQCTGFFEAGDAIRNAVYDLKLPLKLIIGVRSAQAARRGATTDNCPYFTEKVVTAWELPHTHFDPTTATAADTQRELQSLAHQPFAAAILWAE